jgi:cell division protein FtsN
MNKFIVGLILGIAIAGGLAYYLNNAPSQFVNKVTNNEGNGIDSNSSSPIILAPSTKYQEATSNTGSKSNTPTDVDDIDASAPSYDFYDILQGKKSVDDTSDAPKTQTTHYFVQAGSFHSQDMANDMKATLALLGIDAKIKSENNNGKMLNSIIIGPFNSADEADDTMVKLKDNDISATLIKVEN